MTPDSVSARAPRFTRPIAEWQLTDLAERKVPPLACALWVAMLPFWETGPCRLTNAALERKSRVPRREITALLIEMAYRGWIDVPEPGDRKTGKGRAVYPWTVSA